MVLIENPIMLAALGVLCGAHVASALVKGMAGRLIAYVNVFIHALMVVPLGILNFPIEEAVLFYMISVFIFTLTSTFVYVVRSRRCAGENSDAATDQQIVIPGGSDDEIIITDEASTDDDEKERNV